MVDVKPGNAMPAGNMPIGTIVHNVEMKIGKGGQIGPFGGSYAQIVGRDQEYVIVAPQFGRAAPRPWARCMATVGAVSNPDHMNISIGKAGRKRWLGRMPHNAGGRVAMNPVDHPLGGGEGRTSGGRHPVTPWGKPTKGKKTRTNKTTTKFIIFEPPCAEEEVSRGQHGAFVCGKVRSVDGYLLKKAETARASGRA